MFNLTRTERGIIIFLIFTLLIGITLIIYQKSRPPIKLEIGKFAVEEEVDSGRININTASAGDLTQLEGVGKVMAQRIIEHRDKAGKFASIEDIKDVKGIGDAMFEKIKDDITVE